MSRSSAEDSIGRTFPRPLVNRSDVIRALAAVARDTAKVPPVNDSRCEKRGPRHLVFKADTRSSPRTRRYRAASVCLIYPPLPPARGKWGPRRTTAPPPEHALGGNVDETTRGQCPGSGDSTAPKRICAACSRAGVWAVELGWLSSDFSRGTLPPSELTVSPARGEGGFRGGGETKSLCHSLQANLRLHLAQARRRSELGSPESRGRHVATFYKPSVPLWREGRGSNKYIVQSPPPLPLLAQSEGRVDRYFVILWRQMPQFNFSGAKTINRSRLP